MDMPSCRIKVVIRITRRLSSPRFFFLRSWNSSAVSLLPMLLIAQFNVPFYFGGTSLLILVGVAMDFMNQVESYVISSQYGHLMERARKSGRLTR